MAAAPSPRTDTLRELMRKQFAAALVPGAQPASQEADDAKSVGALIEAAAAEKLGIATKDYSAKGRSLIFNLNKNAQLRAGVLRGDLSAEWLVSASVAELATDALKLQRQASADRFHAQRSLGQSNDKVVGWNAGTTGKLEWSHKYEQEKTTAGGTSSMLAAGAPARDEEEEERNAVEPAPMTAAPAEAIDGEELHERAGMEDVEADELQEAESATDDSDSDESWLNGPPVEEEAMGDGAQACTCPCMTLLPSPAPSRCASRCMHRISSQDLES